MFRPDQLTTQTIREQDVYAHVRIAMPATVATEVALKVDVNVGDPVTPAPVEVTYPVLLDESPGMTWDAAGRASLAALRTRRSEPDSGTGRHRAGHHPVGS